VHIRSKAAIPAAVVQLVLNRSWSPPQAGDKLAAPQAVSWVRLQSGRWALVEADINVIPNIQATSNFIVDAFNAASIRI